MNLLHKVYTVFTMDWHWAYNFYRNKFYRWYYYQKARRGGITFYEVQGIKLGFDSAYHHMIAEDMSQGWAEMEIMPLWMDKCKGKGLIYDIGAFNGIYGLLVAKDNPESKVAFFEPDPTNARQIRDNIGLNRLNNCYVYQIALSDKRGFSYFDADGTTGARFRLGKHALLVKTRTLDDFEAPDVMKIDVEGHEDAVIRGATKTLKSKPVLFLEVHESCKEVEEMSWNIFESGMVLKDLFEHPTSEQHLVYA